MITNHLDRISFKMKVIIFLLTLLTIIFRKKLWELVINRRQRYVSPVKKLQAEVFEINQIKVIKTKDYDSNRFIVYFHGGGYVLAGNRRHHAFIFNLAEAANITCYYVEYPLAPDNKCSEIIDSVEKVVKRLQDKEKNKELIFLGDSAGANLALVLSKRFSEAKTVFALSPWLDLSMSNPKIEEMEKQEIMFSKQNLLDAAESYRDKLDLQDPLISPIFDDYKDKNIMIFAGDDDLLFPDVLDFVYKNPHVHLHNYQGLKHDFMFIAQGKEQSGVIEDICEYL